jgi:hypothetical protein
MPVSEPAVAIGADLVARAAERARPAALLAFLEAALAAAPDR